MLLLRTIRLSCAALVISILTVSCGQQSSQTEEGAQAVQPQSQHPTVTVNTGRITNADSEPGNWMAVGRSYKEQHYSQLDNITTENVNQLGLAWTFDLDSNRGQEATPLVVDGVMYVSTAWNKVKALNALTGELFWEFDPEVDRAIGALTCCDSVSRGLAIYEGKIIIATLDGRLIAIDAVTGSELWDVLTIEHGKGYNITGAPRVAKDKVFIGNGGADSGARGYVSAYDVNTGEMIWRFYTVPGDPSQEQENPILEMAAETWSGEWWKIGGGGTAWDAIVYDPELDQLYIGAGNGGPWDPSLRSPGGGDNLFLASIIALNPDTGKYLWHYQEVPEDAWDYTAVQPMVLADLEIEGQTRKVLMQAPKNGFFYVLDRQTGELISAETIVPITWAEPKLDENGKPTIKPEARYYSTGKPFIASPGPGGAHNWQPMAYHPGTGLVYIPTMISPLVHMGVQTEGTVVVPDEVDISTSAVFQNIDEDLLQQSLSMVKGFLLAWDPVKQEEVWRVDLPTAFNGGTMATAGNLVFQGEATGEFAAFNATSGDKLWAYDTYGGIIAAPSTFAIEGEQYVAVIQGWGGGFALAAGTEARMSGPKRNISRVLVFKLGGTKTLPQPLPFPKLNPPAIVGTDEQAAGGRSIYVAQCSRCHGANAVAGSSVPTDLRYSPLIQSQEAFVATVKGGSRLFNGMLDFEGVLSDEEVEAIRIYVIAQANVAVEAAQQ